MLRRPSLKQAMTPFPYSVDMDSSLEIARATMQDHGIGHLPVKKGDELIGVLSDRDLLRVEGDDGSGANGMHVRDILLGEPLAVDIGMPLDRVVGTMAKRRIDCAVVLKEGRLAGIFTTIDACRVFSELLQDLGPAQGDDAA